MNEQLHPASELKFLSHQSEQENQEGWKWPLQTAPWRAFQIRLLPFDSSVTRTQFLSGLSKVGAFPFLGSHLSSPCTSYHKPHMKHIIIGRNKNKIKHRKSYKPSLTQSWNALVF